VVNRPGVALMSVSHGVDDLYQGIVPAMLPFLATERHYSYAAVSGLTLAATVLSSVAQPAFGWLTDRRSRRWIIPAGMAVAGLGVGVADSIDVPAAWLLRRYLGPRAARAYREGFVEQLSRDPRGAVRDIVEPLEGRGLSEAIGKIRA
jgi:MFS family permease